MGTLGLPMYLDRRFVLARNRARMVVVHAWGHVWPHLSDCAGRKLCSLQFPDDLLGRHHRGLAVGVAVPVLPGGRIQREGVGCAQICAATLIFTTTVAAALGSGACYVFLLELRARAR